MSWLYQGLLITSYYLHDRSLLMSWRRWLRCIICSFVVYCI